MTKRIYFLGIGGTLMGSLALLAKQMGYSVAGSDGPIYPPMSTLLDAADITVYEGFDPAHLEPAPDEIIVGNAGLPRGHPALEHILSHALPYTSGAEWLGRAVLRQRWVIAVSGTHGKTTTASMLAWILKHAGLEPGYLIGGAPTNLGTSAHLGGGPFFVVEADEYDTSYFDRRSKFVHYRPRTLIINNLEHDHADIFPDLAAIQSQFHLLLRTVPANGLVIAPSAADSVDEVLAQGCWTPVGRVGAEAVKKPISTETNDRWYVTNVSDQGSAFDVMLNQSNAGRISWELAGEHNRTNALNALAAARHVGVPTAVGIEALNEFRGVKRRLEVIHADATTVIYDDFAHHPTAIRTTLQGLRDRVGMDEIVAVIEPRTHTMSLGTLRNELQTCCYAADQVIWFRSANIQWDLTEITKGSVIPASTTQDVGDLVATLISLPPPKPNTKRHIVIMSNGGFGGIYTLLTDAFNAPGRQSEQT